MDEMTYIMARCQRKQRLTMQLCAHSATPQIKPDGVQRGLISEIIGRFERRGYKLVGACRSSWRLGPVIVARLLLRASPAQLPAALRARP
jgi:Nucleoside diphosphate kinase